jgi:hypothetical protein
MKKWMTWAIGIVAVLVALGLIAYWTADEERPEGVSGPEAERMAEKIYQAVNKDAWDSLAFVGWTFREDHHYLWDKKQNVVEVRWSDYRVLLDPEKVSGIAYINKQEAKGAKEEELIKNAYEYYCNDGFWFHAFTKLHDPGTSRELVTEDEEKALLVTYQKGGVTPGDAYLWYTDSTGLPEGFKMWVSIIPVGGLYFSWENWDTLYNGALVATDHNSEMLSIKIRNVVSGPSLRAVGRDPALFDPLYSD